MVIKRQSVKGNGVRDEESYAYQLEERALERPPSYKTFGTFERERGFL